MYFKIICFSTDRQCLLKFFCYTFIHCSRFAWALGIFQKKWLLYILRQQVFFIFLYYFLVVLFTTAFSVFSWIYLNFIIICNISNFHLGLRLFRLNLAVRIIFFFGSLPSKILIDKISCASLLLTNTFTQHKSLDFCCFLSSIFLLLFWS